MLAQKGFKITTKNGGDILKDFLTYFILFISLYTSINWHISSELTKGEIFRFDKILLFGQVNIYHLFAGLFFLIIFLKKFDPRNSRYFRFDKNFLKNIFWLYFIPVNMLLYWTIYIKNISLEDLGIAPFVRFFVYLIVTYYIQDIFFEKKDDNKLINVITSLEILILSRCCYSIVKYILGFGARNPITSGVRIGTEDDFADFFVLLFIISLTRLLFGKEETKKIRMLHFGGVVSSLYVGLFSFRRYFWAELLIALGIILIFYSSKRLDFNKKVIIACGVFTLIIGCFMFLGGKKILNNYYIGRFLTSFSLLNHNFESQYGTVTGHRAEIADGWYNVKNNWVLGVTPFGKEKIRRFETRAWQKGFYVHNAYLLVWLRYGLLGFILFVFLYLKSIHLGYIVFFKLKNYIGLILFTFLICQVIKNIVWTTAIIHMNTTIIYIFLISFALKIQKRISSSNEAKAQIDY